ncbi:MAG: type II toxin-antitoxin system VapC family toxin [Actinomycetota bacterium]
MGELDSHLVVADTDLVIDFLRGKGPGASLLRGWLGEHELRLTAVTAFELRLGASFLSDAGSIRALFHRRTLGLDAAAGLLAGEVYSELNARGKGIGIKDCLQAGICRRYDLPLATRNTGHFERVAGLRLIPVAN